MKFFFRKFRLVDYEVFKLNFLAEDVGYERSLKDATSYCDKMIHLPANARIRWDVIEYGSHIYPF